MTDANKVPTHEECLANAAQLLTTAAGSSEVKSRINVSVADAWRHLADALPPTELDPLAPVRILSDSAWPVGSLIRTDIAGPGDPSWGYSVALVATWALVHPGREILLGANDVDTVTAMGHAVFGVADAAGILATGRSAFTTQPVSIRFANGSRLVGRVPGLDLKGVKGLHPDLAWWNGDMSGDVNQELIQQLIETATAKA